MRSFIVYLAIATLLWCPYNCALKAAAAQSFASRDRTACCDRCRARELAKVVTARAITARAITAKDTVPADSRGTSDRPSAPNRPSKDGKHCVCEGAVFDAAARYAVDADLDISLLPWLAHDCDLSSSPGFERGFDRVGPLIPLDAGRSLRVSLGSLLL